MKYILKEITPLGKNDLFIANYWPDNQMDFPSISTRTTNCA